MMAAVALLFLPVPWLLPQGDSWGMAWRLDGRLVVNGEIVDPPGRWSWLTVGRPPLVLEVLMRGRESVRDLRRAPSSSRPEVNEPMAAAVGLAHAGHPVVLTVVVEAMGATDPRYPDPAYIVEVNGIALTSVDVWWEAVSAASHPVTFRTRDGSLHTASGADLPYEKLAIVEQAPPDVEAAVGGWWATTPPLSWFRRLALGRSHGLIVALTTYAHAAGADLAGARHVAATGAMLGNGDVTPIGGLWAKAEAARRAGVDVMFYPAMQVHELAHFEPGPMELVPVMTLTEAISHLEATAGRLR